MKKRFLLTAVFFISLLPMLLNQYGGHKGVQEIRGLINLTNPIGIISVLLFLVGVWSPQRNRRINGVLCAVGVIGVVVSEIYTFLTWHVQNITGKISIADSIEFAFPEFYFGLSASIMMAVLYFLIKKASKE